MATVSFISTSSEQVSVGTRATPFTLSSGDLTNDETNHGDLVRAIYNGAVVALSEHGQRLSPDDLASLAFNNKPGFEKWVEVGSMHAPRCLHPVVALNNGKAVAISGCSSLDFATLENSSAVASVEVFDSKTKQWTLVDPIPVARVNGRGIRLPNSNKVLVYGGGPSEIADEFTRTCFIFNGDTGTWAATDSLPTGTRDSINSHDFVPVCPVPSAVCVIKGGPYNGQILIPGSMGFDDSGPDYLFSSPYVLRFDPAGNSGAGLWHCMNQLAVARGNQVAIAIGNGKVLVIGGKRSPSEPGNDVDTCEVYNTAGASGTGSSTLTPPMPICPEPYSTELFPEQRAALTTGRGRVKANAILNDDEVLIIGGNLNEDSSFTSEDPAVQKTAVARKSMIVFNISSNTFTVLTGTKQRLPQGRASGFVYRINGGNALCAHGSYLGPSGLAPEDLFPVEDITNTFTDVINLKNYTVRQSDPLPNHDPSASSAGAILSGLLSWFSCQLTNGDILVAGGAPGFDALDKFGYGDNLVNGFPIQNDRAVLFRTGAPTNGKSIHAPPGPSRDLSGGEATEFRSRLAAHK